MSSAYFLELFDPTDPRRAEQRLRELRAKLVSYFAWRHHPDPDDLADEVLLRAVQRLSSGEVHLEHGDPVPFIYGVARMVALEGSRGNRRRQAHEPIEDHLDGLVATPDLDSAVYHREALSILSAQERAILEEYVHGDRQALSRALDKSPAALRVQICQFRKRLRAWKKETGSKRIGSLAHIRREDA